MLISEETRALARRAEERCAPAFSTIDRTAQYNAEKVLAAFQEYHVSAWIWWVLRDMAMMIWGEIRWTRYLPGPLALRPDWCGASLSTEPIRLPVRLWEFCAPGFYSSIWSAL